MAIVADHKYLVLAVIGALLTAVLVYGYLSRVGDTRTVVVAEIDVPAGSLIEREQLKEVELPYGAVHPDALRSVADAAGGYATGPIYRGQQVLKQMIGGRDSDAVLKTYLDSGYRLMQLPVDPETCPVDLLFPGDIVDVLFVPAGVVSEDVSTMTIEGVRAVRITRDSDGKPAGITLAVTPQQAQLLAFAREAGEVFIVLRGGNEGAVKEDGDDEGSEP